MNRKRLIQSSRSRITCSGGRMAGCLRTLFPWCLVGKIFFLPGVRLVFPPFFFSPGDWGGSPFLSAVPGFVLLGPPSPFFLFHFLAWRAAPSLWCALCSLPYHLGLFWGIWWCVCVVCCWVVVCLVSWFSCIPFFFPVFVVVVRPLRSSILLFPLPGGGPWSATSR